MHTHTYTHMYTHIYMHTHMHKYTLDIVLRCSPCAGCLIRSGTPAEATPHTKGPLDGADAAGGCMLKWKNGADDAGGCMLNGKMGLMMLVGV